MSSRIVFLCDLGSGAGSGHVVRSATLAEELINQGYEVKILTRKLNDFLVDIIGDMPYQTVNLNSAEAIQYAVNDFKPDCLVVDGYQITQEIVQQIKGGKNLSVIRLDERIPPPHDADIVICPSSLMETTEFEGISGVEYTLVRQEVLKARPEKFQEGSSDLKNILVMLGSEDINNLAFNLIRSLQENLEERVCITWLKGFNQSSDIPGVKCSKATKDVVDLYRSCDVAIVAGGVACWELAALGKPVVALATHAYQEPVLKGAHSEGILHYVGKAFDRSQVGLCLIESIVSVISNERRRSQLAYQAWKSISGNGALNIINDVFKKMLIAQK